MQLATMQKASKDTQGQLSDSAANLASNDFITRLQGLPPELFLLIYEYTFLTHPEASVTIGSRSKAYTPPTTLQVSTHSRQEAATAYYPHTKFFFQNKTQLLKWLQTLTPAHRALIRTLHYPVDVEIPACTASKLVKHPFTQVVEVRDSAVLADLERATLYMHLWE
jgi:hypothetical protein